MQLKAVHEYLNCEHDTKMGRPLPGEWSLEETQRKKGIPRQVNTFDCGVFICMYVYYLAFGKEEMDFNQDQISQHARFMIGVSILQGTLV